MISSLVGLISRSIWGQNHWQPRTESGQPRSVVQVQMYDSTFGDSNLNGSPAIKIESDTGTQPEIASASATTSSSIRTASGTVVLSGYRDHDSDGGIDRFNDHDSNDCDGAIASQGALIIGHDIMFTGSDHDHHDHYDHYDHYSFQVGQPEFNTESLNSDSESAIATTIIPIQVLNPISEEFSGPEASWQAISYVNRFAHANGFDISTSKSRYSERNRFKNLGPDSDRTALRRATLTCVCGGMYRPHRDRLRVGMQPTSSLELEASMKLVDNQDKLALTPRRKNQVTIKQLCPFEVEIYEKSLGSTRSNIKNPGMLRKRKLSGTYCIDVVNGAHNLNSIDLCVLPKFRKEKLLKHQDLILNELNNGATNMEILKRMRTEDEKQGVPIGIYHPRDIADMRSKTKVENLLDQEDSIAVS